MTSKAFGSLPAKRSLRAPPDQALSAPRGVQVQARRKKMEKEKDDQKEIVCQAQVPITPPDYVTKRSVAPQSDMILSAPPVASSAPPAPSGILARLGQATRNFVDMSILRREQTEALTVVRKERAMVEECSSDDEDVYETLSADVSPRTLVPQTLPEVKAMEAAATQGKQGSQEEEAIKLFDRFPHLQQQNVSCKILAPCQWGSSLTLTCTN